MRKLFNSRSGFTFVESLITLSIVGIFLAVTWATISFLLLKTTDQIIATRAHFFAVEGMELVKQIRQTAMNRNARNGFYQSVGGKTGSFVLGKKDNKNSEDEYIFLSDDKSVTSEENKRILVEEEPVMTYCRTIEFADVNSMKEAAVTVRWGDAEDCAKGDKFITYTTYLADTNQ